MKNPTVVSYLFVLAVLVAVAVLNLATPFVTVLFAYLILRKLHFFKRKWVAVIIFLFIVCGIFYGFAAFVNHAGKVMPNIVTDTVPKVVNFANRHNIELPFSDLDSLKDLAVDKVHDSMGYLGNFAKLATKEFALLVMGVIVAIGLFFNPGLDFEREVNKPGHNVYTYYCALISEKFAAFYSSFEMVMGAQLIISAINTVLTAIFVFSSGLPYAGILVALTFLFGLLPIVGNLISNVIIVGVAFTARSPIFALWALVFLVGVHKLEYFLNSQIIGARIRNPMWLILLGLIIGESVMGVPGLILAPVVLNFIKTEVSKIPVKDEAA